MNMNPEQNLNLNTQQAEKVEHAIDKRNALANSIGETLGEFKPYDSQLPITELEGTRIVKCLYQVSPKTGKKLQENSYVRIGTNHLTEELIVSRIAELSPYVLGWLQELESGRIKEFHKKGMLKVYNDLLSLDLLIEELEKKEIGSRLNKEMVEAWFDSALATTLLSMFCDKLQLDIDSLEPAAEEKLAKILGAYKAKFASLASPKTYLKEEDCTSMQQVIEACEAENSLIGSRFIARLEKMKEKEDTLLLAL